MCGECEGVPKEVREEERGAIKRSLRTALRTATRKGVGKRANPIESGRENVAAMASAAMRMLAKGSARARTKERVAMRAWLAGDLPKVQGDETRMRSVVSLTTAAVRSAQQAAATLRQAWRDAGAEEMARRATREGGVEGTRWRGVGMEAWKQGVRAATLAGGEEHGEKRVEEQRPGWTMAAALIWYKQRQQARAKARAAEGGQGTVDPEGSGVVVFDVETTCLIDEEVPLEQMEVSVATATWLPHARTGAEARAGAISRTFWHAHVRRAPDGAAAHAIEELLSWFDSARMIVAYNGHAFDMRVLQRHYRGDEERWRAHAAKLHDPMVAAQRVTGRRMKLSTLLASNGLGGKAGTGCDAPWWWAEGKLEALERYCARDTSALADLVMLAEAKVQSHMVTSALSIARVLQDEGGGRGGSGAAGSSAERSGAERDGSSDEDDSEEGRHGDDGEDDEPPAAAGVQRKRRREADEDGDPRQVARRVHTAGGGGDEDELEDEPPAAASAQRKRRRAADDGGERRLAPRRNRAESDETGPTFTPRQATVTPQLAGRKRQVESYDETKRRRRRRGGGLLPPGYMDRSGGRMGGAKRDAVVVGAATVERIVRARYEWRDGGMRTRKRPRDDAWREE